METATLILIFNKIKKLFLKVVMWGAIAFFSTSILAVVAYKFIPVKYTPLMAIRYYQQKQKNGFAIFHREWEPIDSIAPVMYRSVIAAEDGKFLTHNGFDWEAIGDAMENNINGGKKKGGSTISQQTAKNVFLWPGRSWVRKGLESYFTVLIEFFWSKKRIMEVYLNIVETGNGVYGVEAASEKFFKKSASKLTKNEAALIAASLRSPLKSDIGNPDKQMLRYRNGIIKNMKYVGTVKFDK